MSGSPAERRRAAEERARQEFGFVRARNPAEALKKMEAEQAGLERLRGDAFREEFAFALERLEGAPWRFAKSMPENPHEYTLLREWDEEEFYRVVRFIRSNGVIEEFRGWPYICLGGPEFFYWTMGWPVPMTTLINRKPISQLRR